VKLFDGALRIGLTSLHYLLQATWFVRRPKTFGAHALALTPEGKLILVKLRYAPGWRLPGGGRAADEPPVDAALRELREEIGMTAHGEATPARDFDVSVNFKRDTASLLIVRDVLYRPGWSWEVEGIREVAMDSLPVDISPLHESWIRAIRPLL
jgi:8-oxo-dGTP pyrophosphatase MutT (NUDIX family)